MSIQTTSATTVAFDHRLSNGRWLRIPGPTVVHPDAVRAQTRDMIPHRGGTMKRMMLDIYEKARAAHRSTSPVLVWPASGSGGWEAAIVNLLSPGDRVVAGVTGAFGDRFAKTAQAFGVDVVRVDVEWGRGLRPDVFEQAVLDAGSVKAVFITHNETSTGVTNPLRELAAIGRQAGALVIVDAVSSAGAMPLNVDEWDLDWVLSGSQKAWMCPPGLMISAVSERALAAARMSAFPRFYWDVQSMATMAEEGATTTTCALSLLFAFDAALDALHAEGLDAAFERQRLIGEVTRSRLSGMGLRLLAESGFESASVTAFHVPQGTNAGDFTDRLADASGIHIATAQGHLADSVCRIGHMGWVKQPEVDATLEAIEALL